MTTKSAPYVPLAEKLRPRTLQEVIGQTHLLNEGKPLRKAFTEGKLHSMVFWGPPGTGKTTLARMVAESTDAHFLAISAVLSGVKEIRESIATAKDLRGQAGKQTVLFVDEVHRFNKAQQDAFLPHIEDGTILFVGATTENPSFELNNALLSRVRVYVLKPLQDQELETMIDRAFAFLQAEGVVSHLEPEAKKLIAAMADGDARRALLFTELAAELADGEAITESLVMDVVAESRQHRFNKDGDEFYDAISALHKSVRGSDPDAALYWMCRMLEGGCEPRYLARRIVRIASEDVGNADPRALDLCLNAWEIQERLGSPEGELALAQAVIYLAIAAKSNATYVAYKAARNAVKQHGSLPVPEHIRNAPTRLMKELGHGAEYRYAHDEADAFAAGESYLPPEIETILDQARFYEPVERGLEIKIKEKLERLRTLNQQARNKR
ncbi:MAG: replication-associated recombination protein A [Pseudomonadota bacterium]